MPMTCTVSIGWMMSDDGSNIRGATCPSIKESLECAVAHAKHAGRDRVVRYNTGMFKERMGDYRDSCESCKSWFSVSVPISAAKPEPLICPNCGVKTKEARRVPADIPTDSNVKLDPVEV